MSFLGIDFSGFKNLLPAVLTIATAILTDGLSIGWQMAATFAVSVVASRIFSPNANNTSQSLQQTNVRQQVPPDPTASIPMVYGTAYTGGRFVDAALTTDQKAMYYVMVISNISPNGTFTFDTTQFYYQDQLITFHTDTGDLAAVASLTDQAGNVDTTISSKLFISLYISDQAGNVTPINTPYKPWEAGTEHNMGPDSGLNSAYQWASTGRRMNGTAFAIVKLFYNTGSIGTETLQPITFHCSQTLNGTGVAKPGDVWYDYMTNPIYGGAVDSSFVDSSSATALNSYSDQLINYFDPDGNPQTQPRYRFNGILDTGQTILSNIDLMLMCCDSWMKYNTGNGKWSIVINQAISPSYSFNDSNIMGAITVGALDITQAINQIESQYNDKTNRDQAGYVLLKTPSGLLYPNEPVNKSSIKYDLVNDNVQAQYLANRILEQARLDLVVGITTTYDGIQVDAGDVVTITNADYGWSNKQFRVMQTKETALSDGNLGAELQLLDYDPNVYATSDITQYSPTPNSNGITNPNFYSALSAPNVVDSYPYISVPYFDINCAVPLTGTTTSITLFYTTVASPTTADWLTWNIATASNSNPFVAGSVYTFAHITLPANTYYFSYICNSSAGKSTQSPTSTSFVWSPDPSNASSFTLTFNPATLQVPYSGGSPNFAGVICKLYGQNGLGGVDFVVSQNDSDSAFINGTWRIGNSSTTGYGDIVETNITVPNPTDGGTHADFGIPTAMPASPATMLVPVRYKDLAGIVHQVSPATIQYAYQTAGASANKYATGYLYQWSPTTPSNPNGTSIYTWADGSMSSYTGGNGWETSISSNPGTPSIQLWQASKQVTDVASATNTSISWTSGFSVSNITQNGAAGLQSAQPTVFQWAATIPSGPTGTSTYTWATTSFTPTPSGWSLTPGSSPSPGYTLWGATVQLVDSASVATSTISWTTASITARGYSGQSGSSSRICYASTTSSSLSSTPTTYTTSGSSSFPPYNTWGGSETWVATPPSISAGQSVYQSDGIYSPVTGNTVWNVPYLSNLKVGELSAITANLGTVNAGNINGLTITGGVIQTATSGQRITITGSDNYIKVYNSSGTIIGEIGGPSGVVFADATAGGSSLYSPVGSFYGTFSGGNYPGADIPVLYGSNTTGNGVEGSSATNGIGVFGGASLTGGTNHGVRGVNRATNGNVSTSGLIGTSIAYDFYADGNGTNYGPFTGAHDVMVPIDQDIPIGYIVNDVKCLVKKNISNTVFEVTISTAPNQVPIGIMVVNNGLLANMKPAAFIEKYEYPEDQFASSIPVMYPEYDEYKDQYNYCAANAVGEGQVYVCGENGNIAAGDLIVTSSTAGVGMKQNDGIVMNITVAKAREAVTFTDTTTPILVACIYLCG